MFVLLLFHIAHVKRGIGFVDGEELPSFHTIIS